MNMLDRHNEHLFLEKQDLNGNSFIANVNKAASNIDTIKKFNEYIEDEDISSMIEAVIENISDNGNYWVVKLQEVANSLIASKSAFNFATLVTIPKDIASGAEIELPDLAQYVVGTHMLMVSYNGTTCYIGEQYEEIGKIGETSKKIRMLFDLRANDKIMFRVIALNSETVLDELPVRAEGSTEYRTLSDRFADVVNVKDFGAVGDGVTDDTVAIRAAIAYGSEHKKAVYFPFGKYVANSYSENSLGNRYIFKLTGNNYIYSDADAEIYSTGGSEGVKNVQFLVMGSNITIKGLVFSTEYVSSTNVMRCIGGGEQYEIDTNWATTRYENISILNCKFYQFFYSINFSFFYEGEGSQTVINGGVSNILIDGCSNFQKIDDYYASAFMNFRSKDFNLAVWPIQYVKVTNCHNVGGANASAYGFIGCSYVSISNCSSKENAEACVQLENCSGRLSISNILSLDDGIGVWLDDSYNVIVNNVVFKSTKPITYQGTDFKNTIVRPAIYVSCQGNDNDVYNKNRELSSIIISNVVAENGYIIVGRYSTSQSQPNVFGHILLSNISLKKITDSTVGYSALWLALGSTGTATVVGAELVNFKRNIEISSGKLVKCIGCDIKGISDDSLESDIKVHPEDSAAIAIGCTFAKDPINTKDVTYTDCRVGNKLIYNNRSGFYFQGAIGTYINSISAKAGSVLAYAASDATQENSGALYIKRTGTGTSGWREVACHADKHNFIPGADNTYSIGEPKFRWSQVYAASSSISTSDANEKQSIEAYPDEVLNAWGDVELRQFLFNDAVEKKGVDNARIHSGMVAQQIVEVFNKHGLDATKYALLCYDKWDDEYENVEVIDKDAEYDSEGNEISPKQSHIEKKLITPAGDRYGIRYSEALCLEAAYQRRENERLKNELSNIKIRLNVLESKLGV